MRRSIPLAVLLCAVVVLGTAAAGIALAGGSDAPTGTLAALANSAAAPSSTVSSIPDTAAAPATGVHPTGPAGTAPMVTVPALTTAEAPPATTDPAPVSTAAPADPQSPPAPAPVAPAEPAPAPDPVPPAPADVPMVAPYATVIGWHGDARVAYLTFDDGPGPATGRVLDILAASGVKATFCQLGLRVAEAPDVTRRVVAEGHTLCNHSWDHHSPFDALAPADLDSEIGRTQDAFVQADDVVTGMVTGATEGLVVEWDLAFRAPEGAFGPTGGAVLQAAQRARTIPLGWGVDSLDWRKPGVDAIVANVVTAVSPGAVILLHDGGGTDREQTLAALPGIIAGLQAAGYTLAAMPPDAAG